MMRIIVISIFIMVCASCSSPESNSEAIYISDPSLEIIDSLHSSSVDTTGLTFELFSGMATVRRGKRNFIREYPEGLEIKFHNRGEGHSSISAGFAHMDEDAIVTLKEDVKIISEKGDQLETSFLLWDQRYRTIQTDKMVRLIQASGDTSYGFGLVASEDFSQFRIEKGYAGKVKFEDLKSKLGVE